MHKKGEMSILLVEQFLDFALSVGNFFYIMETGAIVMQGGVDKFDAEAADGVFGGLAVSGFGERIQRIVCNKSVLNDEKRTDYLM